MAAMKLGKATTLRPDLEPAEPATSTGDRLRSRLAGMPYAEQMAALEPPLPPLFAGPVQRQEATSPASGQVGAGEGGGGGPAGQSSQETAVEDKLAAMPALRAIVGDGPLRAVVRVALSTPADHRAIVVSLIEAMRPHLAHAPGTTIGFPSAPDLVDELALGRGEGGVPPETPARDDQDSRIPQDEAFLSNCHLTTDLIEQGLVALDVPVVHCLAFGDWGHSYPVFPGLGLALIHGDDVYGSDRPAEDLLQPIALVQAHWAHELAERVAIHESLLAGQEGTERERQYVGGAIEFAPATSIAIGEFVVASADILAAIPVPALYRLHRELGRERTFGPLANAKALATECSTAIAIARGENGSGHDRFEFERLLPSGVAPRTQEEALELAVRAYLLVLTYGLIAKAEELPR